MTRARALCWVLVGVLVAAAGRQIAYALSGGSLADRLSAAGGSPGIAWVATVALAGSMLVTLVGLWLVACGVRERCALELEGWAATAPGIRLGSLARRTVALSGATVSAFTVFESTLHYEQGLGYHGWHCIAGPVHQNAAPILVGLSLIAAAGVTAAELVLSALRRAVARRLLTVSVHLRRRVPRRRKPTATIARAHRPGANLSRGPPRLSVP